MLTVIRLSREHLLPASRPAGHNPCSTKTALPSTLDQHRSADCPAGHQPTPESQRSIKAEVPDALRGINQRLSLDTQFTAARRNLPKRPLFVTILAWWLSPTGTKSALTDPIPMVFCG
ncbi:hypothetical protein LF1_54460 [Rubripirellula obstinata]|uniref:Uncharacterized protein n=1 Tax=Rubripirellula obstinata TaxID=406547 RepID=A0A5B1C872_9BACT|nr:hypothetical protein LF1_54460 [Rubripirellula obstinata]